MRRKHSTNNPRPAQAIATISSNTTGPNSGLREFVHGAPSSARAPGRRPRFRGRGAVVDGPVDGARLAALVDLHRELDAGVAAWLDLGCVYLSDRSLLDRHAVHPTWTHGALVHRILSGVTRAELVRGGFELMGRAPQDVLPPMTDDDVRSAARAELCGYWAWAVRRPTMWLDPGFADLSLTSMARGRYSLRAGDLLSKTDALREAKAPPWLVVQLQARRDGADVASPRLRTAWIAWRDAWRAVRAARCSGSARVRG